MVVTDIGFLGGHHFTRPIFDFFWHVDVPIFWHVDVYDHLTIELLYPNFTNRAYLLKGLNPMVAVAWLSFFYRELPQS